MSRKFLVRFVYVVEVDLDDIDDATLALYRDECKDDEALAVCIAGSEIAEASPQDATVTVENID